MAPIAAQHQRMALTAIADANPALLERARCDFRVESHRDAESLVRSASIDAVYIATPHQFHAEHVLMAVEQGKHVLVEKPMALSLADCDRMIDAARRRGVVLIVGHTHGFDPGVARIREFNLSGELGRLAMIALHHYTDFLYRPRRPEELDTEQGGGIVFNQIPHQVEIARMIAASPVRSVRAQFWNLDPARPTEGCGTALLHFASGAAATLVYSGYDHFDSDELHDWVSASGFRKQARHGAARRMLRESGSSEQEALLRAQRYGYGSGRSAGIPSHPPHFGQVIATFEKADVRIVPDGLAIYGNDGCRQIPLDAACGGRAAVLDELASAILDGVPPIHDGPFARQTLETCLAMLQSSRLGRESVLTSNQSSV